VGFFYLYWKHQSELEEIFFAMIISGLINNITLMGIIYRAWLGGPGGIMGVSVIASSAAIGIAYHYLRRRRPHVVTPLYLIGFGIIVHICMLVLTMTLPSGLGSSANEG
jgi:hypothetical protein